MPSYGAYARRRYAAPKMTWRGAGKYSIEKAWRKSGLGKTVASAARSIIRAGAAKAVSGMGMYNGGGMYVGRGSYKPAVRNALLSQSLPEIPIFSSGATNEVGAVVVSRREYIRDIYGPVSSDGNHSIPWENQSFPINPGLEEAFPWLSQIAQNYDEYSIKQLIYTFRSTVTDIGSSTNGQCGTVIMAVDYNAAHAKFDDKQTMMEYTGAMSGKTTQGLKCGVECDPKKLVSSQFFVRNNPVVSTQDVKTYDHGLFQLALANVPDELRNQALGELWVSYTVELRKPKLFTAKGLGISQDLFVSGAPALSGVMTPLGPTGQILRGQQNNIGVLIQQPSTPDGTLTMTFPHWYTGNLQVIYRVELSGTVGGATPSFAVVGACNVRFVEDMYAALPVPGTAAGSSTNATQSTRGYAMCHIEVGAAYPGVDNVLKLTYALGTGQIDQSSLSIHEYNSGFSFSANNIGKSDAPILTNSAGVIITI